MGAALRRLSEVRHPRFRRRGASQQSTGAARRRRRLGAATLAVGALLAGVAATVVATTPAPVGAGQLVGPFDAGDPDVVVAGLVGPAPDSGYAPGTAVVFATQGMWSPAPAGIERFAVSERAGRWTPARTTDVALARSSAPAWVDRSAFLQAPGVFAYAGRWVMFFAGHVATSGGTSAAAWDYCIGVAVATTLAGRFAPPDPAAAPMLCQDGTDRSTFDTGHDDGGVVDPSPFTDPATGQPYLLFKTGNRVGGPPARLWSVALDPRTGTAIAPGATPKLLLTQRPGTTATIENPDLAVQHGAAVLYYSTGSFSTRYGVGSPAPPLGSHPPVIEPVDYGERAARCAGPSGPCEADGPVLLATDLAAGMVGPGGGSVFTDRSGRRFIAYAQWSSPCASYLYCPAGTAYPDPPPHRAVWFAAIGDVTATGRADLTVALVVSAAVAALAGTVTLLAGTITLRATAGALRAADATLLAAGPAAHCRRDRRGHGGRPWRYRPPGGRGHGPTPPLRAGDRRT